MSCGQDFSRNNGHIKQREYRYMVNTALEKLGGEDLRPVVLRKIESMFGDHFQREDYENPPSKDISRWEHYSDKAVQDLRKEGALRAASDKRGTWTLIPCPKLGK